MLQLLLAAAVTIVDIDPYRTVPIVDRARPVPSAPAGYPAIWKEHVETIVGPAPADRAFNAFVRQRAIALIIAGIRTGIRRSRRSTPPARSRSMRRWRRHRRISCR